VAKQCNVWYGWGVARHGLWFKFEDQHGPGFAGADIVIPSAKVIIEAKLSFRLKAIWQLQDLYLPLCSRVFGPGDWRLIVAFKNCSPQLPPDAELLASPLEAVPGLNLLRWG
jgi:hypothetical protein